MNSLKVKKDDMVEVITGRDKGRRGKVLTVMPTVGYIKVEKINMVKKHRRASQQNKGGIVEIENKLRVDNVKVVCAKCDKAIRVAKKTLEDGKLVRYCRSCGELLDAV